MVNVKIIGTSANRWAAELAQMAELFDDLELSVTSETKYSGEASTQLLLFEESSDLGEILKTVDRKGRAVFLVVNDPNRIPMLWHKGQVDDVICFPFRPVEVLSKIKRYFEMMKWDEVEKLNLSFTQVIQELKNDLELASRLQKINMPNRFADLKGFKIASRYLAGARGGGDYFDLAEVSKGEAISLILTHSSSYGLSSAVLNILLKSAVKFSTTEGRSVLQNLRTIYDEIILTLGEKDELSLAHAVINRKDLTMKIVNVGAAHFYYGEKGESFRELPRQGGAIKKDSPWPVVNEIEVALNPDDRLVCCSQGMVEAVGAQGIQKALQDLRGKDMMELVNELVFKVKAKLPEMDDFPDRDCTVAVMDVDSRVIRLARS